MHTISNRCRVLRSVTPTLGEGNLKKIQIYLFMISILIIGCAPDTKDGGAIKIQKEKTLFGITNAREFFKDSFIALAQNPKTEFETFSVGTPWKPYDGELVLFFRLPDKSIFNISSSNAVGVIKRKGTSVSVPGGVFKYDEKKFYTWEEGAEEIQLFPYFFIVKENRLLGLRCYYNSDFKKTPAKILAIGKDKKNLFNPPLTLEQLVQICGEPDKVVDSFKQ